MKTILQLLLFGMLYMPTLFAQYTEGKKNSFDFVDQLVDVTTTTTGEILALGHKNTKQAAEIWLCKLTADNQRIWNKKILSTRTKSIAKAISVNDIGEITAVVHQNFANTLVIHIDKNGNNLWTKGYNSVLVNDVQVAKNQDVILVGETSGAKIDFWAARLQNNKQEVWKGKIKGYDKAYANTREMAYSVVPTPENGCLIAGESGDVAMIIALNESGNYIWKKEHYKSKKYYQYLTIDLSSDNQVLLAGTEVGGGFKRKEAAWLYSFNKMTKSDNERILPTKNATDNKFITSAIYTSDNQIVTSVVTSNKYGTKAELVSLDKNHKVIWSKTMKVKYANYLNALTATKDGGFVVVGSKEDQRGKSGGWIIKYKPEKNQKNTIPIPKLTTTTVDQQAPIITITKPKTLRSVTVVSNGKTVEVAGYVTDNSPIQGVRVQGKNAKLVSLSTNKTKFTTTITLASNQPSFWVEAIDDKGNKAKETFQVKVSADTTPPLITLIKPTVRQGDRGSTIVTKGRNIHVRGYALDDSGIKSVRVHGRETFLQTNSTTESSFDSRITLAKNQNEFWVEAIDKVGNKSKVKFVINIDTTPIEPIAETSESNTHLLVIGIDEYEHWPTLKNGVKDALDVKEVLLKKYNFTPNYTTTLTNKEATSAGIRKALRDLTMRVKAEDEVVIYFSGHGYYDKELNEGYWIPIEAGRSKTESFISNADILTKIRAMEGKHIFLMADACFAGTLFAEKKGAFLKDEDEKKFLNNVARYPSRWGLTSGRYEVVDDGIAGKNSPFADALLFYLKTTPKAEFAVSDLVQYVKKVVANNSEQTPIGSPLRNVGDKGGEFIFKKKK